MSEAGAGVTEVLRTLVKEQHYGGAQQTGQG